MRYSSLYMYVCIYNLRSVLRDLEFVCVKHPCAPTSKLIQNCVYL